MVLLGQDVLSIPLHAWDLSRMLDPKVMVFMIPITAIVVFGGLAIIHSFHRHRERMEMIRAGIHPDHPEDIVEPTDVPTEKDFSDTAHYGQ